MSLIPKKTDSNFDEWFEQLVINNSKLTRRVLDLEEKVLTLEKQMQQQQRLTAGQQIIGGY